MQQKKYKHNKAQRVLNNDIASDRLIINQEKNKMKHLKKIFYY